MSRPDDELREQPRDLIRLEIDVTAAVKLEVNQRALFEQRHQCDAARGIARTSELRAR